MQMLLWFDQVLVFENGRVQIFKPCAWCKPSSVIHQRSWYITLEIGLGNVGNFQNFWILFGWCQLNAAEYSFTSNLVLLMWILIQVDGFVIQVVRVLVRKISKRSVLHILMV